MKLVLPQLQAQFDRMCATGKLFQSSVSGHELADTYLLGFGEDPVFRDPESSVHNCNMCKNFIHRYANIVAVDENLNIMTLFDVSIVSDTWDFWQVITDYIPRLKETIMAREGRFVVRPDSGDPVDIICGPDPRDIVELNGKKYYVWGLVSKGDAMYQEINYKKLKHDPEFAEKHLISEAQIKGAYECLWDIFGGTTTDKGYKVLDTHIGLIYGDSITLEKQKQIYERLEAKGFAATNIVLGFGSYTYQLKSRDSLGFAMKATWCQINDTPHEIFKSPKTDSGVKKSLKGLCQVLNIEGKYHVKDQCTPEEEVESCLQPVFMDGVELKSITLKEIRNNVDKSIQASLC